MRRAKFKGAADAAASIGFTDEMRHSGLLFLLTTAFPISWSAASRMKSVLASLAILTSDFLSLSFRLQRMPLSHCHWTEVTLSAATSTSKGPYLLTPRFLPLSETL